MLPDDRWKRQLGGEVNEARRDRIRSISSWHRLNFILFFQNRSFITDRNNVKLERGRATDHARWSVGTLHYAASWGVIPLSRSRSPLPPSPLRFPSVYDPPHPAGRPSRGSIVETAGGGYRFRSRSWAASMSIIGAGYSPMGSAPIVVWPSSRSVQGSWIASSTPHAVRAPSDGCARPPGRSASPVSRR